MEIVGGTQPSGRDGGREDRLRAVLRNAERAGRELEVERADSVRRVARTFGSIDSDELMAQIDARLTLLERQVQRLVERRDEADRALQFEVDFVRARVAESVRLVETTVESEHDARTALEERLTARLAAAVDEALASMARACEERTLASAETLREALVASWERTVRAERAERAREHMEALEAEIARRAAAARALIVELRESVEAQALANARAAQAFADAAFAGIADRLPAGDAEPLTPAAVGGTATGPVAPAGDSPGGDRSDGTAELPAIVLDDPF